MKIYTETSLEDFEAWSGGKETLDRLKELDRVEEVESMLQECYPDGISETALNDFLWFDTDTIADWLDMKDLFEEDDYLDE